MKIPGFNITGFIVDKILNDPETVSNVVSGIAHSVKERIDASRAEKAAEADERKELRAMILGTQAEVLKLKEELDRRGK